MMWCRFISLACPNRHSQRHSALQQRVHASIALLSLLRSREAQESVSPCPGSATWPASDQSSPSAAPVYPEKEPDSERGQETRNSTRTEGVSIGLTSAEMLAGCQLPPIAGTAKSKANRLWAPWISLPKPQAGGDGTEALKHAPNKFQACVLSPRVRDAVSTTGCLVVC